MMRLFLILCLFCLNASAFELFQPEREQSSMTGEGLPLIGHAPTEEPIERIANAEIAAELYIHRASRACIFGSR